MHANQREDIKEMQAGDIVAVVGLKNTTTGDSLCDPEAPLLLESLEIPVPVISIAIEPKSKADMDKLGLSLQRIAAEDPSFMVHTDEETGQTFSPEWENSIWRLLSIGLTREFNVDANIGKPQVAYKETITREVRAGGEIYPAERRARAIRPCRCWKSIPGKSGSGFLFENKIVGGVIPKEYIPAVEKGIR